MNKLIVTSILILLVTLITTTCNASWLIFHKPAFKGKIVDIETNEPIEGVVVVAFYRKQAISVGDSVTMDFDVQEALTDKNGNFKIPSYTNIIQPLSWSIPVEFIIIKPGYVCDGRLGREEDFSGSGTTTDRDYVASWNPNLKYKILKSGIVMLRKVSGKDRIESSRNVEFNPYWDPDIKAKLSKLYEYYLMK